MVDSLIILLSIEGSYELLSMVFDPDISHLCGYLIIVFLVVYVFLIMKVVTYFYVVEVIILTYN